MERVNCANCGADNSKIVKYCSGCGFELPKLESKRTEGNDYKVKFHGSSKQYLGLSLYNTKIVLYCRI